MQTVGRIGSYISKSVYTVSGTFHPFGGAVDIIVVEQPDGSYKSSPWYVRFGKFQGVLKTKEKVVRIRVNDVEADFHMLLDSKGEAFFMQEVDVDVEEGDSEASPPSSSGEDMEGPPSWPLKSKSCNYNSNLHDPVSNERKVLTRTKTRQSQFFGCFGRSPDEEADQGKENAPGLKGEGSLEIAERAADLLDLRWSTNLASFRCKKDNDLPLSSADTLKNEVNRSSPVDGSSQHEINVISQTNCQELKGAAEANDDANEVNRSSPVDGSSQHEISVISQTNCQELKGAAEANDDELNCITSECIVSASVESVGENTTLSNSEAVVTGSLGLDKSGLQVSSVSVVSEVAKSDSDIQDSINKLNGLSGVNISLEENAKDNSISHEECREACIHTGDQITIVHEEKVSVSEGTSCGASESIVTECYSQLVCRHQSNDSLTDIDSQSITFATTSNFSTCLPMYERKNLGDKGKLDCSAGPLCDSHVQRGISVTPCIEASRISEEDGQLVLGSLDDFGPTEPKHLESSQSDHVGKSADSLCLSRVTGADIELSDVKCCPSLSLDQLDINDYTNDVGFDTRRLSSRSSDVCINEIGIVHSEGPIRTARSLPNMVDFNYLEASDPGYFSDASFCPDRNSCTEKNHQCPSALRIAEVPPTSGYPPRSMDGENMNAVENSKKSSDSEGEKNVTTVNVKKKKVRTLMPTSKQLASLNLKQGKNVVIFTFSTAMLGNQQVDARIFLWRWDDKIVISDVDGTITRSDLLGQVMPLVGMDWSQTGVAHLFTAIKENGYQLFFLSARSISQSYITRQFLLNIKQDGKALPEGPVVISPDGLFPSLFREVVRRAPHEFKISCLEDIKALFPPDRNPFYAGFGNRDTDEVSYLKVGIPRGKIFIINPKGEVAVNRRVDTKSYVTLQSLVNGMFPPRTCTCEQEDFNSWNYWKLPPPTIE